eukprot:gene11855-5184_t
MDFLSPLIKRQLNSLKQDKLESLNLSRTYITNHNPISKNEMKTLIEGLEKSTIISSINLTNNQLDSKNSFELFEYLQEDLKIKVLILNENDFQNCENLAKVIRMNHKIEKLSLKDCKLGNKGAQEIIDALYLNTKIKSLSLQKNGMDHGVAKFIYEMLKMNETLEHLDISKNVFTDESAEYLSKSLRYNFNIVRLDISRIELGDIGIIILAKGLQYNFFLQFLNISNNNMKDKGAYAIANLLKHNNQLKELDMSYNLYSDYAVIKICECIPYNESLVKLRIDRSYLFMDLINECMNKNKIQRVHWISQQISFINSNDYRIGNKVDMGNRSSISQEDGHSDLQAFHEVSNLKSTENEKTFQNTMKFSHDDSISNFLIVNQKFIVTGSFDHTVKVWNLEEKHYLTLSNHPKEYITCLDVLQEGILISCGNQGIINIWDMFEGTLLCTFQDVSCINDLCIWNQEIFLVATSSKIVGYSFKKKMKTFSLDYHSNRVQKIVKMNENEICSCGFDGTIIIYNLKIETVMNKFNCSNIYVRDIFLFEDKIVVSCGDEGFVDVIHLKFGSQSHHESVRIDESLNKVISDGKIIISVGKKIHLINFEKMELMKSIEAHDGGIEDVIFYGDLFVTSGDDKTIKLWNKLGYCLDTLEGHNSSVNRIKEVDSKGTILSSGFDNDLFFWSYHIHFRFPYLQQTNNVADMRFKYY